MSIISEDLLSPLWPINLTMTTLVSNNSLSLFSTCNTHFHTNHEFRPTPFGNTLGNINFQPNRIHFHRRHIEINERLWIFWKISSDVYEKLIPTMNSSTNFWLLLSLLSSLICFHPSESYDFLAGQDEEEFTGHLGTFPVGKDLKIDHSLSHNLSRNGLCIFYVLLQRNIYYTVL